MRPADYFTKTTCESVPFPLEAEILGGVVPIRLLISGSTRITRLYLALNTPRTRHAISLQASSFGNTLYLPSPLLILAVK